MTKLLFSSDGKVTVLEKIVAFLSKRMEEPRAYGLFHIVSLLIILGVCALIIYKRHKFTEKTVAYFIFFIGLTMLIFEIYKQLVITYEPAYDVWVYELYAFPFQFCSTPTYIALLSFLFYKLRLNTVYQAFLSFLATYGMIAAIVVLFFGTSTVLCPSLGINIQTMVHHGLMLVMSILILSTGSIELGKRSFIGASAVFLPLLVIAMILNACIDGLDLFYVSPNSTFVYKAISDIFFGGKLPYLVYLIGYVILFTLGAALILFITHKIKSKKILGKERAESN